MTRRDEMLAFLDEAETRYETDPAFHYRTRLAMDLVNGLPEIEPGQPADAQKVWRLVAVALLVADLPEEKLTDPGVVALLTSESERVRERLQAQHAEARRRLAENRL